MSLVNSAHFKGYITFKHMYLSNRERIIVFKPGVGPTDCPVLFVRMTRILKHLTSLRKHWLFPLISLELGLDEDDYPTAPVWERRKMFFQKQKRPSGDHSS